MRIYLYILLSAGLLAAASLKVSGQNADALIRKGNRYYKQNQIDQSQKEYEKAVQTAPDDPTAHYNLGNVQFRKNNFDEAAKSFAAGAEHSPDSTFREKSLYNKGVALVKGQKLKESIDAWENALKINPSDQDTRENLQKALLELKRQQQQQDQKNKKDQKDQQKKQDQQNQQQQPKPQPSRLTKQQAEQYLKSLQEKENELQQKMNQNKSRSGTQPDKDW
jgi:Ca-activated chloride channel homolog